MERFAEIEDLERAKTARSEALAKGPATRIIKADAHAASLTAILGRIEAAGRVSLNAIARALTAEGIPTAAGTRNWTPSGVARVKARLAA